MKAIKLSCFSILLVSNFQVSGNKLSSMHFFQSIQEVIRASMFHSLCKGFRTGKTLMVVLIYLEALSLLLYPAYFGRINQKRGANLIWRFMPGIILKVGRQM